MIIRNCEKGEYIIEELILFRGQTVDTGEWVKGFVFQDKNDRFFIGLPAMFDGYKYWNWIEVVPETVGQLTSLLDKNGLNIFKDDICTDGEVLVQIVWSNSHMWGCKVIKGDSKGLVFPLWHWDHYQENGYRQLEVIGNIHDNPELIKDKENV